MDGEQVGKSRTCIIRSDNDLFQKDHHQFHDHRRPPDCAVPFSYTV